MGGVSPTYDCSFFHRIIIVALFVPKLPLESPTRPIVATSIVIAVCGTNSNSIRNNLPPVEFAMPLFPLVVLATDGLIFSRFKVMHVSVPRVFPNKDGTGRNEYLRHPLAAPADRAAPFLPFKYCG